MAVRDLIRKISANRGLLGGGRGIRTPETLSGSIGGIRSEVGALFGPDKSIRAGENLFA